MDHTNYWRRQEPGKPLFPDLQWNRPENKLHAGKLLIIGGNQFGFTAPAEAYSHSLKAGIGVSRAILPNALEKIMGKLFPEIEFAPSTPSGSFGRSSLAALLDTSEWANAVLLAGDFGKNSETTIVIESLLEKYVGEMILAGDSLDHFTTNTDVLLNRPDTTLVLEFAQLQKIITNSSSQRALTSGMDFLHFIESLHTLSQEYSAKLVVKREGNWFVAVDGQVTSTESDLPTTDAAASVSVWLIQNTQRPLEALTTALL